MRFIAAIISFVLAAVMIGFGIAQRTILAEPDQVEAVAEFDGTAPITLIDGATLNSLDGRQKIELTGEGNVFAAYGRTSDLLAWIGEASYNELQYDSETGELATSVVKGTEEAVPNPRGSDLWLTEYSRDDLLSIVVNVPEDVSVIAMTDGTAPAPTEVAISWPQDNRTPWSGPLIVGGVVLLLVGLGLYLWALAHLNKSRGPRRKQPKLPRPPRRPIARPKKPSVLPIPRGRRKALRMAVIPVTLTTGLLLSACSADYWPAAFSGQTDPTPTPSATTAASDAKPPAVTIPQLTNIIGKVATAAKDADAAADADVAASRFAGAALEARSANYAIRAKDSSYPAPAVIPKGEIQLALPQQTDAWPRTVFTVVQEEPVNSANPVEPAEGEAEAAAAPMYGLMLVQATPRDNFKVVYAVTLEPSAKLPEVVSAETGTARLKPDVQQLLQMAPDQLALAYGDVLLNGESSEHYDKFDTEGDSLIASIGQAKKAERKASLPAIASMAFANAVGPGDAIAMATNNTGAIVSVYLHETETVTPVEEGATINAEGAVKTLSGVSSTTKGTKATYGDQLLFYVPPSSSTGEKIKLLGFTSALISAKEL